MKTFLLNLFLLFTSFLFAQSVDISFEHQSEIEVCGAPDTLTISIINNSSNALSSPEFILSLPEGVNYLSGSIEEFTNHGLYGYDLSSNANLIFKSNNIPDGDSVQFQLSYSVDNSALIFQNNGGVFRHNLTVNHTNGVEIEQSNSFNILYPALSILNVTPTSQSIISGSSTTRSISIINGGNGKIDQFFITDVINNSDLVLTGVNVGTFSNDTIFLSGSDFSGIGNGDNYLDQNESIIIEETLTGTSCNDVTISSAMKVHWGCKVPFEWSSATTYANVSIDFQSPNLTVSANESFGSCFGNGSAFTQELVVKNTGSGVASQVEIDLYKSLGSNYDESIYSRFDETSLNYRVGVNGIAVYPNNVTAIATQNTSAYACLGTSPKGRLIFTIPSIAPGEEVFVNWDVISCCIQTCSSDAIKGWKAEVEYTDVCNIQSYNASKVGQDENKQNLNLFTETPLDINAGQTKAFKFLVSSFENNLPEGPGAHYKVVFTLDQGLVYQNLDFKSNGITWQNNNITYDASTNIVTALFYTPLPFNLVQSELVLDVIGNCGTSGWKNISVDVAYIADTSCATICEVPLECNQEIKTYLHCPGGNCNTLNVADFTIERTNYGLADNDQNGIADNNGSLDMSQIRTDRAMVGDTIQASVIASIGSTSNNFEYAQFNATIDYGSALTFLSSEIKIYDASANTYHIINGNQPTIISNGSNERVFKYNLNASNLVSLNPALTNYVYAAGDSISIDFDYIVSSSVSGLIKETTFYNEFFLSQVSSPSNNQKEACNFRNGRITLIGYSFRNDWNNNVNLKTCSNRTKQYFGMSNGNVGNNYAGGNLFPYEYRSWGNLKTVKLEIPANYSFTEAKIVQYRTMKTNSTATQAINNVTADSISGNFIFFNIQQYYNSNQLNYSDDGFHGYIQAELVANCNTPQNTFEEINWSFDYQKSNAIDGQTSGLITTNYPDKIKYNPAKITLSSNNPFQNTINRMVAWNYKLKNAKSGTAVNTWIYLQTPSNLTITSVINNATGQSVPEQNGFYQVGDLNGNSTMNFTINGEIQNCDEAQITAVSGFDCIGYPSDLSSFTCPTQSLDLFVEPYDAAFQTRIASEIMADPCVPQMELTFDITSVLLGNIYDMTIDLVTPDPNKIKVVDGSSYFQYNVSNAYTSITDPSFSSSTYQFNIADYDPNFPVTGIPGITDVSNNRYRLKTMIETGQAFQPGDFLFVYINGKDACGDSLPTIRLAIDPSSKFEKDNTSGIHLDFDNTWGASWGDYDNDGYDDLFIPVNAINEPSILYHNNGDGTFSKVTTGPIASDLGASISGNWGDYDNDGFLDLFVSNNQNSSNRLYHNDGNGNFTSVQNSPLIDQPIYSHFSAWADYNKDGNLDLVVSDYHPTNFNYLFKGDGNGGFVVDEASQVSLSATSAVGLSWADYDNDGDPDLFIANTNGENNQLFNNQNGILILDTSNIIANDGGYSVGGAWGDYDNDGDLDLFVSNSRGTDPNFFYENIGNGDFIKLTQLSIVTNISNSNGAAWADYDNDGDLDLVVSNDQSQKNFLFANNGDKTFTKIDNAITEESNDSYGMAWSDYDNDGDYDLIVANVGSNTNNLFNNAKASCTNHISVRLNGCNSNSFGIGATIKVKANINGTDVWQTKNVSSQGSSMGGQNSSKILFGISDATAIDSLIVLWPSGVITTITNPNINQTLDIAESCGSKVCGVVYFDANDNGIQDSTEQGIANAQLLVSPNNFQVFTNEDGYYEFYLEDGNYTIDQVVSNDWQVTAPLGAYTLDINKNIQAEYCGNDFGNKAICLFPEFEVEMGAAAFRRGLTNDLNLVIHNKGAYEATQTLNVDLTLSNNVILKGNQWDALVENSEDRVYTFYISGMDAMSNYTIELFDSVDVYSDLNDLITVDVNLSYNGQECNTANNSSSLTDIVVGSIDPNDKLVLIDGIGVSSEAYHNQALVYKIRFQNLGNYAAQRVQIEDQLSEHLDWSTFRKMSSSHPFSVSIVNGKVTWINNNIELPDSTSNPEGSNGYVQFKIFPKQGLKPFQIINNDADIQFDYNDFIRTNNTEIMISPNYENDETEVILYPNPTSDWVNIYLINDQQFSDPIDSIVICSPSGKVVLNEVINDKRAKLDLSSLSPGIYFANIRNIYGELFNAKIIVK
ncbi:FG-GAP-like repeat-containing protein [Brumimicrobium aurantiacum]|uniref:T9SS C-terminal target domain-containing protein n=1 Tax=Brumimicrobium aurantiacum TaxID=1737063 RepID=A0A3E1F1C6_9FLAO|nr:FG-GAP-like repeat-containing protein [Brumimicrobium aurantiacum]RFC55549.1 T9SS C-terminal target domain-containing protein [Brumimicrobium aurantiacum]